MSLSVEVLGLTQADPYPNGGRYPCGSLIYKGVWYYGTYCLSPYGSTMYGDTIYNWPFLGPFVGFRYSTDFGKTWTETPHTPVKTLFDENGLAAGYPVKIGTPHFVYFGKTWSIRPMAKPIWLPADRIIQLLIVILFTITVGLPAIKFT